MNKDDRTDIVVPTTSIVLVSKPSRGPINGAFTNQLGATPPGLVCAKRTAQGQAWRGAASLPLKTVGSRVDPQEPSTKRIRHLDSFAGAMSVVQSYLTGREVSL